MRARLLIPVLLAAAMLAAPAHAIPFQRVDANHDGVISPEEAFQNMNGMMPVHVAKCDRNRDGVIEQNEYGCLSGLYDALYRQPR